jgi:hypothetical protein
MNGSLTSSTGTDDKAAIQAVLNTASPSAPLFLILDGVSAIDTSGGGLLLKSYTTIHGLGRNTGLSWLGGTNTNQVPLLQNANPLGTGAPTDTDIALENFTINGNMTAGHGNGGGNPYSGKLFLSNVRLVGVARLRMCGLRSYHSTGYGFHLANITDAYIENTRVENGGQNSDGIHVNGPASNVVIDHVSGVAGDDMIALTADDCHEQYSSCQGAYGDNSLPSTVKQGAITRVVVSNVFLENSYGGWRLLSGGNPIDDVTIRNVSGTVYSIIGYMDRFTFGSSNFGAINIEDIDVVPTRLDGSAFSTGGSFRQLNMNLTCKDHTVTNNYGLIGTSGSTAIQTLNLRVACSNSNGLPSPLLVMSTGATVGTLNLSGTYDPNGGSTNGTNPLIYLSGGTITNLLLSDLVADHINNLVQNFGGSISTVTLSGGSHTNAGGNATVLNSSGTISNLVIAGFSSSLYSSGTIGSVSGGCR